MNRGVRLTLSLIAIALAAALAGSMAAEAGPALQAQGGHETTPDAAVGTGFTYHGRLLNGGSPASGQFDFRFTLFDALSGGNQEGTPVTVTNQTVAGGIFTTVLDFGSGVLQGETLFLQIEVRPAGGGAFTLLSPRQAITPVPYAATLRPSAVISGSTSGNILRATNTGTGNGIQGSSTNTLGGSGVYGSSVAIAGSGTYGVSTGLNGTGVEGEANNGTSAKGVSGSSSTGYGVYGQSTAPDGRGVYGIANTGQAAAGVLGSSSSGFGVRGESTALNREGVFGISNNGSNATGVYGLSSSGNGVVGVASASGGKGVYGLANNGTGSAGVYGESDDGAGVYGYSRNGNAVYGFAHPGDDSVAVVGISYNGMAGSFTGNVQVIGSLSKSSGSFKIDHPLDPENKYLYHSFVESPDMKNIYDGVVTTDARGEAAIELPEWFEALNRDFRYQLTPIGQFTQAIVLKKIESNRFTIKTDRPNVEVSWQVTGIRKDPYAEKHRIQVEEEKSTKDRGRYLHPELYGQPESTGIGWDRPSPEVEK